MSPYGFSVVTTQLCICSVNAALDNTKTKGCRRISLAVNWDWAMGHTFPMSDIESWSLMPFVDLLFPGSQKVRRWN